MRPFLLCLIVCLWVPCCLASSTSAFGTVKTKEREESEHHACCPSHDFETDSDSRLPLSMAFLIGSMKSGTTFLFDELMRHPNIKPRTMPDQRRQQQLHGGKEPHFFCKMPLSASAWEEYLRAFALSGDPGNASLTFIDATPNYMHLPAAACRIRAVFPRARIIALLREPVQRAISHWNMHEWGKKEKSSFDEEVLREMRFLRSKNCSFEPRSEVSSGATNRTGSSSSTPALSDAVAREVQTAMHGAEGPWERGAGLPSWNDCFRCRFKCGTHEGTAIINVSAPQNVSCKPEPSEDGIVLRGLYAYQLEWWLKLFPPSQLMVLNSAELQGAPDMVLDRVLRFLEQDPKLMRKRPSTEVFKIPDGVKINDAFDQLKKNASGWSLSSKECDVGASDEVLEELRKLYSHANKALYRLMAFLGPASGWTGTFSQ